MTRLVSMLIGYCFGCILTAEIVCRYFTGKDIRDIGTGNPGMANVMANVGKVPGTFVLAGDILKTALAMGLSYYLFSAGVGKQIIQYAGLGAVLGHNFPLWRKGRGGKGVAVTCTWLILGFGIPGVLCCLSGAAAVFLTGWLPLGAVIITLAAVPMAFWRGGTETGLLSVVSCILMFSRHYRGLGRILRGEEKTRSGGKNHAQK